MSDNAPQFKVVNVMLQQLFAAVYTDSSVQSYVAQKGICWRFIPAEAPWMGGVYERMVGIVKRALRKSLGKAHLQTDQLSTLLTEIEVVVNTRPLLYVTSDEVACTLSPADFLHSHVSLALPPPLTDPALAEDPDYQPSAAQSSHASQLFKVWLEGQNILIISGEFGWVIIYSISENFTTINMAPTC